MTEGIKSATCAACGKVHPDPYGPTILITTTYANIVLSSVRVCHTDNKECALAYLERDQAASVIKGMKCLQTDFQGHVNASCNCNKE